MRVVAAMSGGVDSAVAAARMLEAGHEVVGVHLALSQNAATLRESARGCCTIEDAGDARRVADMLGIPFYVWDMAERFTHDVVEDFIAEYAAGRTPNPCLRCNEKIKFAALLDKALALGFYVAAKPDSHDVCFIPAGDTRRWLTDRLGEQHGDIVEADGTKVGEHSGAYAFTVGQRRGLHLGRPASDGAPRYVVEVRPDTNTVVVGTGELLGVDAITGDHARWCGPAPEGVVSVGAQVRAHGEEIPATAWADDDTVEVRLERRIRGVAPGQSVVLYDGTRVVGSATIARTGTTRPPAGPASARIGSPA